MNADDMEMLGILVGFFPALYAVEKVRSRLFDRAPQQQPNAPSTPQRPAAVPAPGDVMRSIAELKDGYLARLAGDFEALRRKRLAEGIVAEMVGGVPPLALVPQIQEAFGFPRGIHPPRYARLADGVDGRVFAHDLADLIESAKSFDRASTVGTNVDDEDVERWADRVDALLGAVTRANPYNEEPDLPGQFEYVLEREDKWGGALLDELGEPSRLRVILAVAVDYLVEVQNRMPNYRESGHAGYEQPSQVSVTINGGTIINPQIAAQIHTIGSNITAVLDQGDTKLAHALRAMEDAVVSLSDAHHELRQETLDQLEYLSEAAKAAPEKRKRGMVKSSLESLAKAASTSAEIGKAYEAWRTVLDGLLS